MQETAKFELDPQVRFRAVGAEGVVVHIGRGEVMVVNALGLRVLEGIRDAVPLAAMLDSLCAEYAVERATLASDIDAFLEGLRRQGVVTARAA